MYKLKSRGLLQTELSVDVQNFEEILKGKPVMENISFSVLSRFFFLSEHETRYAIVI